VNSLDALSIVVWILPLYFLSSVATFTLIAMEAQGELLRVNAFIAVINILGNITIIPVYGFIGSAWVTLISQGLLLIGSWFLVMRQLTSQK
jgi:O-antigen/teichoic acid export membrane protein